MNLCSAAVIDHPAPEEGDEIARTPCSLHLPAEGRIAVIWTISLRPANERFYHRAVEDRRDYSWMVRHVEFGAVSVWKIVSLTVASIVDGIAFEALIEEPADNFGKAQAPIMRGLKAGLGSSNSFRVPCAVPVFRREISNEFACKLSREALLHRVRYHP